MLLRFEVSNHRSIMDPVELSMIAVDSDRPSTRSFERLSEEVLTVAGIYGPNASGKSNVLEAFAWLSHAVRTSLRSWDESIPREPFKFGSGPSSPTTFKIEMIVDGVRVEYHLELDDSSVLFEGLYSYPERRKRMLFERDGDSLNLRRGLGGLSGTRELLTPTTLALSAAMRFPEPEVQSVGRVLASMRTVGVHLRNRRPGGSPMGSFGSTARLFINEDSADQPRLFEDPYMPTIYNRESALALLRFADLGISDVHLVEDSAAKSGARSAAFRDLRLVHRIHGQELPFEIAEESSGTMTWFQLIGPTLAALERGDVLLVDEIDAGLHPRLSARLLELFQDPDTNPHGAQIIFTTHDTSLLNHLNRDEVWLTDKLADGSTSLTGLAEYGGDTVRKSLNLEKAYMQGRFGAVPDFDQAIIRDALSQPSIA